MTPSDRDRTAERLLRSSAEHSSDPEVEIDWDGSRPEVASIAGPGRSLWRMSGLLPAAKSAPKGSLQSF